MFPKSRKYRKAVSYTHLDVYKRQAQDYRQPAFDTPVALVIGSEGKGISRLVKEECDVMLTLPMEGTISSLNASVACAVLLYQIHAKRFPLK